MDSGFDSLIGPPPAIAMALASELGRGISLLVDIDDASYAATNAVSGSVGAHFRHNLNFVEAVLNGVRLGRIDYANRERDVRLETDRHYASKRFSEAIEILMLLRDGSAGKEVSVISEIDSSRSYRSSIGRELEFAHSHTVHHHALIAEKLRGMGVSVDVLFGVAPSTKRFWNVQQISVAEARGCEI